MLYLLLSLLIWLVGRFVPSFGLIDLKLSLRQMLAGRGRAAMTLLALVVGVFSLSTITLLADSVNNLLQFSLEEASGGNVTISVGLPQQLPNIERRARTNGRACSSYHVQRTYNMKLVSVQEGDTTLTPDDLRERLKSLQDALIVGPTRRKRRSGRYVCPLPADRRAGRCPRAEARCRSAISLPGGSSPRKMRASR